MLPGTCHLQYDIPITKQSYLLFSLEYREKMMEGWGWWGEVLIPSVLDFSLEGGPDGTNLEISYCARFNQDTG